MMINGEMDPKKKKKPGLLPEKMGLDQGSDTRSPAAPPPVAQPGLFPGSAAMAINDQSNNVSSRVEDKLRKRKGVQNAQQTY